MNININNLKEELSNLYKNIYLYLENSSWFHYIKEKYEHLQPTHKKAVNGAIGFIVLSGLLYYPASHLYTSVKNMKDFTDKKQLIQELISLSAVRRASPYTQNNISGNLKDFIFQRSETVGLPKDQITTIDQAKSQNLRELKMPTHTESVRVELKNLNLKELIQYGHQLETLNENLKVVSMDITESVQKENYFNAAYTLSLFSLRANQPEKKPNLLKKSKRKTEKRKKINTIKPIDNLKKEEIKE